MKPVRTEYTNAIFKLPGGTDENDLPVERTTDSAQREIIISTWELSEIEKNALMQSGKIELIIWGSIQPPVALAISGMEEADE